VFDNIDSVEIREYGILAKASSIRPFALGGIGYHGMYPEHHDKNHEYGHLIHERELRSLYLPIAGLSSLWGITRHYIFDRNAPSYFDLWTEKTADRYGGVNR
jgi:hypothetical protein